MNHEEHEVSRRFLFQVSSFLYLRALLWLGLGKLTRDRGVMQDLWARSLWL